VLGLFCYIQGVRERGREVPVASKTEGEPWRGGREGERLVEGDLVGGGRLGGLGRSGRCGSQVGEVHDHDLWGGIARFEGAQEAAHGLVEVVGVEVYDVVVACVGQPAGVAAVLSRDLGVEQLAMVAVDFLVLLAVNHKHGGADPTDAVDVGVDIAARQRATILHDNPQA